ncbi:MAG TPA: serine/threonine-protein kinase [Albitalea sp.]|nr:serine/threonine-protein kinase [Albitalea sp.]
MSTAAPVTAAPANAAVSAADDCALAIGTRLGEFEIERVLGAGGFGIVYLALDHTLRRRVAIKEYVPSSLAVRNRGATLSLRSVADAATFAAGLRSFINEARLLASFDHPALVKVHRFWEENGTAYMAMPYYAGRTLKEVRRGMAQPPDEAWMQGFVQPLLGALEVLHAQHVYHRDISPDNIMLLSDGQPLLLDFGSARKVVSDAATQSLTAILKPHFAPIEQYADITTFPQGPWTDLYALGAVVHFMLKDALPMPAALRAMQDDLPLLAHDAASRFLAAIDWSLAVHPKDRPDSVATLRRAIGGEIVPPLPSRRGAPTVIAAPASAEGFWPQTLPAPPPVRSKRNAIAWVAGLAVLLMGATGVANWALSRRDAPVATAAAPVAAPVRRPAPVAAAPVPVPIPMKAAATPVPPMIAVLAETSAQAVTPPKPKPSAPAAGKPKPKTAAAAAATGPTALDECAAKNFLMRPMCVRRACEQPALRIQPQCVQMREQDEMRAQTQLSR